MFLGFGFRCLYQRGKFHFFVLRAFDSTVHGNAVTVSTASVLEPKQRPAFVIQNLGTNVAGKWFDTSQVWSLVSVCFSVFSDFRCVMFYMSCLSHLFLIFLIKKNGKRPAVEPSDF